MNDILPGALVKLSPRMWMSTTVRAMGCGVFIGTVHFPPRPGAFGFTRDYIYPVHSPRACVLWSTGVREHLFPDLEVIA